MSRILALDSSTRVGSVALLDGEHLAAEYTLGVQRTHSERLMPAVARVVADAGWEPGDIEGIVVSTGPGSFTGLRIAVATAKALSYALKVPVVGVSTLDSLAWGTGARGRLVSPMINARRKQVYTALYRLDEGLNLIRETEYAVVEVERWAEQMAGRGESILCTGDGAILYEEELRTRLGERCLVVPEAQGAMRAAWAGSLGAARLQRGEREDPFRLGPLYVQPPEAEVVRHHLVGDRKHGF